jgi:UDP-N-acetylmuramate dehydrogenase
MPIQNNVSLKNFNTFGFDVTAKSYIYIDSVSELKEIVAENQNLFILGGGSNIVLTKDLTDLVVHLGIKGKEIITQQDTNNVLVKAQAGENWHEFVQWTIQQGFGGLENLSLIPGNVGTTPIQNIGAYGVEIKDTFYCCEALNRNTLEMETFSNEDCQFDYRESVFKNHLKNQYIIVSVSFKLTTNNHQLKTTYGAIETEIQKNNIQNPSLQDISNAVIAIRESKLPNPKFLGNSGSFFKNPIVNRMKFEQLKTLYTDFPFYEISNSEVKIPAGWLIEQTGFKGKRFGDAGVHEKQALVLVNYGAASGEEILALATKIQEGVFHKFGIKIEQEVTYY